MEVRSVADIERIAGVFDYWHDDGITSLCELKDGTIISASLDEFLLRWTLMDDSSNDGVREQFCVCNIGVFYGPSSVIYDIILLKGDNSSISIVVGRSEGKMMLWNSETRVCIKRVDGWPVYGAKSLAALSDGTFATASKWGGEVNIWNNRGDWLAEISSGNTATFIVELRDGSVAFGVARQYDPSSIVVRRSWLKTTLVDKCAMVIGAHGRGCDSTQTNTSRRTIQQVYCLYLNNKCSITPHIELNKYREIGQGDCCYSNNRRGHFIAYATNV